MLVVRCVENGVLRSQKKAKVVLFVMNSYCLQCFDTVGLPSGRASVSEKLSDEVLA